MRITRGDDCPRFANDPSRITHVGYHTRNAASHGLHNRVGESLAKYGCGYQQIERSIKQLMGEKPGTRYLEEGGGFWVRNIASTPN